MGDETLLQGLRQQAPPPSILLFEKDGGLRKSIFLTLMQQGLIVQQASDASGVREILDQVKPDIFVIDEDSSKGITGDLIEMFRESSAGCRAVVVTTTQRMDESWRQAYKPDMVLYKPFDIRFLYRKIIKLL